MNGKRRWIMSQCEEIALWEGFDDALVGLGTRCGSETVAVYDRDRMLATLSRQMDPEEAVEYLDYNVTGAHIGPLTPIVLDRIPPKQKLRGFLVVLKAHEDEVQRLRDALTRIAENRDEPYSADFAKDMLARRNP
jgi:hypothetical protein